MKPLERSFSAINQHELSQKLRQQSAIKAQKCKKESKKKKNDRQMLVAKPGELF